jgi:hypothetical protein
MLQNWINLVKYEFVDLRVSFPMTPRSLQLKFYNSRYDRSYYMCDRAQMLQNWINLVKYEFVDLRVSFPMTPRSLQLEFYNSRYDRFGGTHQV